MESDPDYSKISTKRHKIVLIIRKLLRYKNSSSSLKIPQFGFPVNNTLFFKNLSFNNWFSTLLQHNTKQQKRNTILLSILILLIERKYLMGIKILIFRHSFLFKHNVSDTHKDNKVEQTSHKLIIILKRLAIINFILSSCRVDEHLNWNILASSALNRVHP